MWNAWYHRTKHLKTDGLARRTSVKRTRKYAIAAWFAELKAQLVCLTCGQTHPACLVFHHTEPAGKEITVAVAISRAWSKERVMREIAKCVVLCANCHMKLHAKERADAA